MARASIISFLFFLACLAKPGTGQGPRIEIGVTAQGIPASEGLYTALPERSPVVRIRSAEDGNFGGDVRIVWNGQGLVFDLKVLDASVSPIREGSYMWTSDSVQIAINTLPEKCFELGFALKENGPVVHYAWQAGGREDLDWSNVKASGERTSGGYRLNLRIGWEALGIDPKNIPLRLGVDILFNDGGTQGQRRSTEWTPGIGTVKDPGQFARVELVRPSDKPSAVMAAFDQKEYESKEVIKVRYLEYAFEKLGPEPITLTATINDGKSITNLVTGKLPAVPAGFSRTAVVFVPGNLLDREGKYSFKFQTSSSILTVASLVRIDTQRKIRMGLNDVKTRFSKIKDQIRITPEFGKDFEVRLGLTVGERFIRRVETGGPEGKQSPAWSLLQVEELGDVLNQTQARMDELAKGKPVLGFTPLPAVKTIRDGLFYDYAGRPVFYSGHCLYDTVDQDLLIFKDLGVSLIQRERGPICLQADGSFHSSVDHIVRVLQSAHHNGLKVDMMLATHYFPGWAASGYSDINKILQVGFIDYNIDHPQARKVVGEFMEKFVGRVKNEPAIFSFSLANEPRYANSGRDQYSRPAWIEFIRKRHGTIEKLNVLYGTNYSTFERVPVPGPEIPKELKAKRVYYDWGRFNQTHFTDWFHWLNRFVKTQAPEIPTHVKIMPHALMPESFLFGIDPELICGVTDLAGCDNCGPIPNAMWYDLLHSFRGQAVFDSETHLIGDNDPPTHFPPQRHKSLVFQGAMHHQPVTTFWVWDEPRNPDISGSIYFRPANIYSAGKAMFDLNRLSRELEAINLAKPRVALLYSQTSVFWESHYSETCINLYNALTWLGQEVTFISERQLSEGQNPKVDLILLPRVTHVPDGAVGGLERFIKGGGKVVMAGSGNLELDEYHRKRKLAGIFSECMTVDLKGEGIRKCLRAYGIETPDLEDIKTQTAAKGVEYRVVPYRNTVLVPMVNTQENMKVLNLKVQGPASDLIENRPVNPQRIELNAWDVMILQISPKK
jgi:hypothetical protein